MEESEILEQWKEFRIPDSRFRIWGEMEESGRMEEYLIPAKGKNPEFQGDGRILDSGFGKYGKIPDSAFRIPHSGLWILHSGFGKYGIIPDSGFGIPDSGKMEQFRIPHSGFRENANKISGGNGRIPNCRFRGRGGDGEKNQESRKMKEFRKDGRIPEKWKNSGKMEEFRMNPPLNSHHVQTATRYKDEASDPR